MTKLRPLAFALAATAGCVNRPVLTAPMPPPPAAAAPVEKPAPIEAPAPVAIVPEAPAELSVEQKMNEKLAAAGPGVYLHVELDAAVIPTPRAAALIDGLKSALEKKGFRPEPSVARAPSELTVTSFDVDGRRGVVLEWGLRRTNRRPLRWFRQTYVVRDPFDAVWAKFSAKIHEGFAALELPIRPAPDPGACAPRFGFDADARGLVKSVLAGSPAARAGVRAGDVIEGIDSRPVAFDRPDAPDDVYERRLPVPLRLDRGGQVIRTTIRAEVVCEPN